MWKLIGVTALAVAFAGAAQAQTTIYTAPNGHITGYGQQSGGTTVYTAPNGHITGYGQQNSDATTYTAPNGHVRGRATTLPTFPTDDD
jgi:hypothetical protein